jgi:hypothetical protein
MYKTKTAGTYGHNNDYNTSITPLPDPFSMYYTLAFFSPGSPSLLSSSQQSLSRKYFRDTPHDLPGEFADVAVAVWDCLEGSFQSFDHDLDKLVYDYIAFFRVFLELDMLFIVPEKCEEKSLVKGVSLEIALEKFLDVDVPKILDGKLCILEKDY